jgi:Na+-driven multidrug efflux pump
VIGGLVLGFGTATMAAFGIGGRLFELAWIPLFGIGTAVSTLVGQNLGARKPERAEKTVLHGTFLGVGIMSVLAVLVFLFAPAFIRIFNSEPAVIEIGGNLLRFGAFVIMFISITAGLTSAFWGSGDTVPMAIIMALSLWGIQIPLAYTFVKVLGLSVEYIWLSIMLAEFAGCLLTIFWFSRGKWKRKKI